MTVGSHCQEHAEDCIDVPNGLLSMSVAQRDVLSPSCAKDRISIFAFTTQYSCTDLTAANFVFKLRQGLLPELRSRPRVSLLRNG
jgi:hypothetical protein